MRVLFSFASCHICVKPIEQNSYNPYLLKWKSEYLVVVSTYPFAILCYYISWFFLILKFIKAMQIQSLIDFRISLKEKRNKVWETFSSVIKLNGLKPTEHTTYMYILRFISQRVIIVVRSLNFHVFLDFGCWMLYLIIRLKPLA